jgi:hypothetical protein
MLTLNRDAKASFLVSLQPLEKFVTWWIGFRWTVIIYIYRDFSACPLWHVALSRRQAGHRVGCSAGDIVPYITCVERGTTGTSMSSIAERPRLPMNSKTTVTTGSWILNTTCISQQVPTLRGAAVGVYTMHKALSISWRQSNARRAVNRSSSKKPNWPFHCIRRTVEMHRLYSRWVFAKTLRVC